MADTGLAVWPAPPAHLHLLGICGYAVSGLALCCQELGFRVTGSDEDAYPPTTDTLRAASIPVGDGHDPANLERWGVPDLVILGNQVQPGNRELAAARDRGLPVLSEAEAYRGLAEGRTRAVICGTHGKTTRLGDPRPGGPFVFEGDEYTTSALDPRAKFLHWEPQVLTLLNLELDHPDIYPDLDAYTAPYRELVAGLPASGWLLYNAEDALVAQLAAPAMAQRESWGLTRGDWVLARPPIVEGGRQRITVRCPGGGELMLRLHGFGPHNAADAVAALATAVHLGADPGRAAAAAADCHGAARRFEVLGAAGEVTVVDDYAHHPTKIRATIAGARQRFGEGVQLVMVHVPHTYSRTRALLPEYRDAFLGLDLLVLGPIEPARERHLEGTVSSEQVAALVLGPEMLLVDSAGAAIEAVLERLRPPAVVVCSSVRGFDGVAGRLLIRLRERQG